MLKYPFPPMHFKRAGGWLLHSGIQNPDGGVSRYRSISDNRNLAVSTEITGYTASAYAWLYKRTREQPYLDAAVRTARFLADTAWNAQLETFPFECSPGSPGYFFDCGITIRGLLAVHRLTGEQRLREIALACGHSMARDYLTQGAIHPIVSLPDRKPWPYEKRWSREPGCFQLKSALAWRDLSLTGPWEQALSMALDNYTSFLPGTLEEDALMDRLHAYCYFMEALLAEPSRPECAEALRISIPRVSGYLRAIEGRFARADVYAQLLRVRLLADRHGILRVDRRAVEDESRVIAKYQYPPGDPALEGGFCFGSRQGAMLPYVNPVSTVICAQALDMFRNGMEPKLEDLI